VDRDDDEGENRRDRAGAEVKVQAGLGAIALLATTIVACGTLIGVDERHAGDLDAAAVAPGEGPDADAPDQDVDGGPNNGAADGAAPIKALSLGQYDDPVLAIGEDDLLVRPQGGARSKIIRISKKDPTHPKTIYDQPSASAATRVSTMDIARGQVWFTTSDRKLRRMTLDGLNPTLVDNGSSSIVARSAKTLWTVAPDYSSDAPSLRWIGADLLSMVPEATLAFGGPVMEAFGSDDELVFGSRTSNGIWSLHRWRPFATTPLLTLATFDAYPSWIAVDSQRVLVYHQDEGTVVSWSRVTPQTTPTTILVDVPAPVAIKSDGTNLVMRSQTGLTSCVIATCASSMRTLPVPTTFGFARFFEIDAQYAYFFHAKSSAATVMTLVRVPR
jgi:hypothetical protein